MVTCFYIETTFSVFKKVQKRLGCVLIKAYYKVDFFQSETDMMKYHKTNIKITFDIEVTLIKIDPSSNFFVMTM